MAVFAYKDDENDVIFYSTDATRELAEAWVSEFKYNEFVLWSEGEVELPKYTSLLEITAEKMQAQLDESRERRAKAQAESAVRGQVNRLNAPLYQKLMDFMLSGLDSTEGVLSDGDVKVEYRLVRGSN